MKLLNKFNFKTVQLFVFFLIFGFLFNNCNIQKQKVINIGVLLPLTGDIAVYGQSSKMGMEIAYEEFDKDLSNNNKINVIYEDEKGLAKDAVNAIKKLISTDKTPVVLGGISSTVALSIAPIAEQNKTVLMCPFASSPLITNAGDYIFRIMPSDAFQAELLPKWLEELKYTKVAIIYVKNDWGESLKNAFTESFKASGGTIVFEESINEGSKDLKNIVAKLNKVKQEIDAIFAPTYPEEGGLLLKQIKESGIDLPVFGGDTWANDLIIKTAGKSAEGVKFLAPMQYEGNEYIEFKDKFRLKFNKDPDLPASAGYDAMKIILYCIKNIINEGKEVSGENIKMCLYQIKDFKGATGSTTFDNHGDVISKQFSRRSIKDGKIIYVER